jgi:hypothetical protein
LFLIDRVFKKQGDCHVVATLFVMRREMKTLYGKVKSVAQVMKVCCRAQTYQVLAERLLGADRKPLHSRRIPAARARVIKIKPKSLGFNLIRKLCRPGPPGSKAAAAGRASIPPRTGPATGRWPPF